MQSDSINVQRRPSAIDGRTKLTPWRAIIECIGNGTALSVKQNIDISQHHYRFMLNLISPPRELEDKEIEKRYSPGSLADR